MSEFQIEISSPIREGFTEVYGGPNQGGHQPPNWYIQYGMDLGAAVGTAVYAAFSGHITRLNPDVPEQDTPKVYGAQIFIRAANDLMGAFYTHLSDVPEGLAAGSLVERGDVLGYVMEMPPTAAHLHLALVEIIGGPSAGQYVGVDLYDLFQRMINTDDIATVTFFQSPGVPPQSDI